MNSRENTAGSGYNLSDDRSHNVQHTDLLASMDAGPIQADS